MRTRSSESKLCCSRNINHNMAKDLSLEAGISISSNLDKYLVVPLYHERFGKDTFNFIIKKIENKLSNWKKKRLSLVGRLTLTKAF